MTYQAVVTREDGWWIVRVPEVEGVTQARHLGEVATMARDLIAVIQDLDVEDVDVEVVGPSTEGSGGS